MIIRTAILLLTISLAGCAQEAPAAAPPASDSPPALVADATPEQIEAGKRIVELQCISCHAVRADDKGHNPNAPALRTLAERYPVTGLEEAFALGIMTGHPGMPEFRFRPDQIKAILAYIESIQTRRGA
jgi:mono/diheme cytochrome c family protein